MDVWKHATLLFLREGEGLDEAQKEDHMSVKEQFGMLKIKIRNLTGQRHDASWSSAQDWKDSAREVIKRVFRGMSDVQAKFDKKIKRLFTTLPCCGNVQMDPRKSDLEAQRLFDEDITNACSIIDECISICEKLKLQFN